MFFGLYYLVNKNQYGIGRGGIQMPDAQVPVENYSAINFANVSEESLSPPAIMSELEGTFTLLETGGITNEALRNSGLCLLSGYFTDFSHLDAEIDLPHDGELRLEIRRGGERRGGRRVHDPGRRRHRDRIRERRRRSVAATDTHGPMRSSAEAVPNM